MSDLHLWHAINWRIAALRWATASQIASIKSDIGWLRRRSGRPHPLPGELIVSLTSFRPRFRYIVPTLRCLLAQSVKADRTILWISHHESPPAEVAALQEHGLEIRFTADFKSYKKIVPTLAEFPNAFIVTADDDAYYGPHWLQALVQGWDGDNRQVVCHVARSIRGDHGSLHPYEQWPYVKQPEQSQLLFPVGIGGVLYPPSSLPPATVSAETFQALCPDADDVWLYWMGQLHGNSNKKVGHGGVPATMPGSQTVSLFNKNVKLGGNDNQIAAMVAAFGNPLAHFESN